MGLPFGGAQGRGEDWVAAWTESVSERAAAAKALSDRVSALSATASGADQAVRVTVAGSGVVTDLRLDERVLRWSPDEIGNEIMTVMRRAQGLLAARVAEAAEETVGMDSETGRTVVAGFERRFPTQPEDDGGPEVRRERQARRESGRDWG